jgi:hypothetical protein
MNQVPDAWFCGEIKPGKHSTGRVFGLSLGALMKRRALTGCHAPRPEMSVQVL